MLPPNVVDAAKWFLDFIGEGRVGVSHFIWVVKTRKPADCRSDRTDDVNQMRGR